MTKSWIGILVAVVLVGATAIKPTDESPEILLTRDQVAVILQQYSEINVSARKENPSRWTPDASRNYARQEIIKHNWTHEHYLCLDELWTRESNWRTKAENKSSGAYGIPQALPAEKMAVMGKDYRRNPQTQIKWGLHYIKIRYDDPCNALAHHDRRNWY